MLLRIVEPDAPPSPNGPATAKPLFRDVPIREHELFLLPANTPHNPIRFADTVGLVVELPRPTDSVDTLRWYCQRCAAVVHEASFHCVDLGTQVKAAVQAFVGRGEEGRKCGACGAVCEIVPSGVVRP